MVRRRTTGKQVQSRQAPGRGSAEVAPRQAGHPLQLLLDSPSGKWLVGVGFIGMSLLAYVPALQAGYIWDDDQYVTNNPTLRDAEGLVRIWTELRATVQYYPMVFTTFWLEHHLWGLQPAGYHTTNVLLHGCSAFLLWLILRRMRVPGAWLAGALFALHPVHVESVAWVTERKNVLSCLLYLTSLWAYLRFRPIEPAGDDTDAGPPAWRFYGLALACFVGALLSKTVTCSLPAAILLLVWWKRGRIRMADVLPLLPFFVIGLGLASVTSYMEKYHVRAIGPEWDLSMVDRTLIAGRVVWFYLYKLLLPVNLCFNYPRWEINSHAVWEYAFPLAAVGLVVALWLIRRRIGRGPLVAALFFGGTLFPALGFFNVYPMRYSFVADHFQYHASLGPLVLLAAAFVVAMRRVGGDRRAAADARVANLPRMSPTLVVPAAMVLVVLGGLTFAQARHYRNAETLWLATLKQNPNSWMAHNNLGGLAYQAGDYQDAAMHYDAVLRIKPNDAKALYNLGRAYEGQGRLQEARDWLEKAVAADSDDAQAYFSLANLYAKHFDNRAKAIALFEQSLAAYDRVAASVPQPERVEAPKALVYLNMAMTQYTANDYDEAEAALRKALSLRPDYDQAWITLAAVLEAKGDVAGALDAYRNVSGAHPSYRRVQAEIRRLKGD